MIKAGFDCVAWFVATAIATSLRYSDLPGVPRRDAAVVAASLALIYLVAGLTIRLHQGRTRTGSLEEIVQVGLVAAFAGGVVAFVNGPQVWVARSVPVGATICFVVIAGLGRAAWRSYAQRTAAPRPADASRVRTLIAGAGDAGHDLVVSMLRDPSQAWNPVAFVDDDRAKRHLRIRGVAVVGGTDSIAMVAASVQADALVIAIPSASSATVSRISEAGRAAGLDVKVLPATSELLRDDVGIRDIRDVNLSDVLGRKQIDTDIESIAGYLAGRRVLVTGAGGSIGSELCRQISRFEPSELIMLDRDESALHAVQLSLTGRALLEDSGVVLCDIRDLGSLSQIFLRRRPEVVFHAAALKHLPMLEQYPLEAIKTNVIGTRNVLEAASRAGVERLVNISTDKAANPSSVLGYSKRLAERLTSGYATSTSQKYLSVRFGNVLGSRGSVLTAFAQQVGEGGPVTITHPEVTRYFMTVGEACQLVVQAGAIGESGEALVLDMGTPMRILDVARHLISLDGRDIPIEYTGLRRGEKLHEDLFGRHEPRDVRPWHPLVSHVPVDPIDPAVVDGLVAGGSVSAITSSLLNACWEGQRPDRADWADIPTVDEELRETVVYTDD
ncbi:MAG: nucleoside-diphosphate sugar epimerase/dehydratase [Nocardioides sp.]